ncbi:hypothetical protein O3P69_014049 [Scylla paramamosain]|uniref:Gustatory receptor n=1 Tax=Scylla paramamosain TaxID=85552 RepID=A0AAW0SSF4_SCYPA
MLLTHWCTYTPRYQRSISETVLVPPSGGASILPQPALPIRLERMVVPPQHQHQREEELEPKSERKEGTIRKCKGHRPRSRRYYELLAMAASVLQAKEGEVPPDVAYRLALRCAMALGLHLVRRQQDGSYAVCKLTVMPAVLLYLVACTLALGLMGYKIYSDLFTYNAMVMMMPIIIGCIFIVLICVVLLSKTRCTMRYMESLQEVGVTVRPKLRERHSLTLAFLFAGLNSYITLGLIPDFSDHLQHILLPVLLNSIVPYLLDIYVWVFVSTLAYSWGKLEKYVQEKRQWVLGDVEAVAATWLTLTRLLALHNQVFSVVLTMRLTLFALETLSLLYGLLDVRGTGDVALLVLLSISETDVVIRAFAIGMVGEQMMQAYEGVLSGLLDAIGGAAWPDDKTGVKDLGDWHEQQGQGGGEVSSAMNKRDPCGKDNNAFKKDDHDTLTAGDEHGQCDASAQAGGDGKQQADSRAGRERQPDETFTALHRLVAHIEARPADLHVLGMGRLSQSLVLQLGGVVLTYLVMVVQLNPK